MPTITPFLWFDTQAEEAMQFYTSIFKGSKVLSVNHIPGAGVISVEFELEGQRFMALNGGPKRPFTEAISFFVSVETQQEIDELWGKLTAGGGPSRCGWLTDKFGLTWQIIPKSLGRMLTDPDPAKSQPVMQAMLQMDKLDLAKLQAAYSSQQV